MILITGATGFLGTELRALLQAKRIAFKTVSHEEITSINAGDLRNVGSIIHLAGMAHRTGRDSGDHREYEKANVALPVDLARRAAKAQVSRFLFISTAKVNGETSVGGVLAPGDSPEPQGHYALSKWQAEKALNQELKGKGTDLLVIRPPLVYGPGAKGNLHTLLKWLQRGIPLPFARASAPRSMVASTNLAGLLLHLTVCSRTDIERSQSLTRNAGAAEGYPVFLPADLEIGTADLIRRMARLMGRRPLLWPFPPGWFRWSSIHERIFQPFQVDSTSARATGWKNRVTPEEALKEMVQDFLASHVGTV